MTTTTQKTKLLPLEKAICYAGGKTQLGQAIGVHRMVVDYWLKHRNGVPTKAVYCVKIEEVTNGLVKASHLNPELFD